MGSVDPNPNRIPTVDISPFIANSSSVDAARVVDQLSFACSEYGFFYLEGHGVPEEQQLGILDCAGRFARLSEEEKMEVFVGKCMGSSFRGYEPPASQIHRADLLPDTKEAFIFGREVPADDPDAGTFHTGPNQWPSSLKDHEFREPLMKYHSRMLELVAILLDILARGLPKSWNCPSDVFDPLLYKPSAPMRLLHYKEQDVRLPNQFGAGDHTDFGNISILLQQDNTEGLEVLDTQTQEWIPVPVLKGSLLVLMGDMMHKLTAGHYRSARHRVLTNNKKRLSAAWFFVGNLDKKWRALDGSGPEMTVGEHVRQRAIQTIGGVAGEKLKY